MHPNVRKKLPITKWTYSIRKKLIEEINYAVNAGHYRSSTEELRENFKFSAEQKFSGLKTSFDIELAKGQYLDSNAYLFVSQDKFIKFRTSFLAYPEMDLVGDKIVNEILPELGVPPESAHMKKVRAEHKKAQEEMLLKFLLNALRNKESESTTENTTEPQPQP